MVLRSWFNPNLKKGRKRPHLEEGHKREEGSPKKVLKKFPTKSSFIVLNLTYFRLFATIL